MKTFQLGALVEIIHHVHTFVHDTHTHCFFFFLPFYLFKNDNLITLINSVRVTYNCGILGDKTKTMS